jgi:hypothetical protein
VQKRQRWIDLAGAAVLIAAVGALVVWRLQS